MTKKDYMSIHLLRIFACALVIIIHTTATPSTLLPFNSFTQILFLALNQLSKAAVPIFVFISGYTLSKLYKNQKISAVSFWTSRLPKIVLPYIIWSFVYFSIFAYNGKYPLELGFIIRGLLYGTFVYHIYFMIIIIQFYILFPLFHNVSLKIRESKFLLASIIMQLSLTSAIFQYKDRSFTSYLIYFAIGMLLATKPVQFDRKKTLVNAYFFVWMLVGTANFVIALATQNQWIKWSANLYSLIFVLLSAISILALYLFFEGIASKQVLSENLNAHVKKMSQATPLIYFSHPIVLFASEVILNALSIESLSVRALIGFASVIVFVVPFAMRVSSMANRHSK